MLRLSRRFLSPVGAGALAYVASDMDGTVLGKDHTLSDFTQRTLFALTQERKVPFVFATGRVHADVAVVNEHLQTYFARRRAETGTAAEGETPVYLITSNGSVAHNARTNEVVMEKCIEEALVRELYELLPATETRVNTHFCQRERWYCRMDWEEMLQFHKESGHRYEVLEKIPDTADIRSDTNKAAPEAEIALAPKGDLRQVTKVFFTSWDKPLLDQIEVLLHERYGDRLSVSYSASYCIDVTAKGCTKAEALRAVLALMPEPIACEEDGVPASPVEEKRLEERLRQTVAFGNDLNDATMLKSVGQGFVMGNSNPRLVESCAGLEMVGHHDEDGVAHKICELFDLSIPSQK